MLRMIILQMNISVLSTILVIIFVQIMYSATLQKRGYAKLEENYISKLAAHIVGGKQVANQVARDFGYENLGQVGDLADFYLLRKLQQPSKDVLRMKRTFDAAKFLEDDRVLWAEQQVNIHRFKRDLIEKRDEERAYRDVNYDDDYWLSQWYLYDLPRNELQTHIDLHVIPVWAKNITGAGVVVTVLDDGLEYNHTDLHLNYDSRASYDFNSDDHDPSPRYDSSNENKHGTRCAGEIAMIANNHKCGVGVAYDSHIGGLRMLDGVVTDSLEAKALSFNVNYIDIFSASWGPKDDGKSLEKPGLLAETALKYGIEKGRQGKGIIYVWASGNGGIHSDNCNCDGYAASIYTLSISSVSQQAKSPWYAEHCSSTMATTYSSGSFGDQKITSTDLHNLCTDKHTGTSASAPLAAGIFALVLQVNPHLTWRDLQHLVAWTSDYEPLKKNPGWSKNSAGYWVNNRFGFGLLNAASLVNMSDPSAFQGVPEKYVCEVKYDHQLPRQMNSGMELLLNFTSNGCQDEENEVIYLEHVILNLDMTYTRRGNLQITLESPSGTTSELLAKRPNDDSSAGFRRWPLMSVHTWGENPKGIWILKIIDTTANTYFEGVLNFINLELHGMATIPLHVSNSGGKRSYRENNNSYIKNKKIYSDV